MKKLLATALFATCLSAMTASALGPTGKFGVGLRVGAPVGFDAKYWLDGVHSLNFALGWTNNYGPNRYGYSDSRCYDGAFYANNRGYCNGERYDNFYGYGYGYDNFHLHGDYIWHNFNVIHAAFPIPLYFGVGGQYEYLRYYSDSWLGLRGTFGIDFMPNRIPFDFFAEITPAFWVMPGPDFTIYGGVGARFWF